LKRPLWPRKREAAHFIFERRGKGRRYTKNAFSRLAEKASSSAKEGKAIARHSRNSKRGEKKRKKKKKKKKQPKKKKHQKKTTFEKPGEEKRPNTLRPDREKEGKSSHPLSTKLFRKGRFLQGQKGRLTREHRARRRGGGEEKGVSDPSSGKGNRANVFRHKKKKKKASTASMTKHL